MQLFRKIVGGKRGAALFGIALVLLALVLQILHPAVLTRVGLLVFDGYQRAQPRPYRDAPVRIVDIDDESIRRLGQWPWPRTDLARLTQTLTDAGASAVAFDIVFSEPDRTSPARIAKALRAAGGIDAGQLAVLDRLPDNDARFADVLRTSPAVLGLFLTRGTARSTIVSKAGIAISGSSPTGAVARYTDAIQPLGSFAEAAPGNGFVSIVGDADGIVRKAPLLSSVGDTLMPSLGLDALRTAQGAGSIIVKASDGSGEIGSAGGGGVVSLKVGDFTVPTTKAGELWMYFTPPHPERVVPAWKLLSGTTPPAELQRLFGGQIVFVGAGAMGLRDLISTPVQERELGVMVHAQAVEQMILGDFLERPDWAEGVERTVLVVFGVALALALPSLGALRGALVTGAMMSAVAGGSWYAFRDHRFLIDPTYPALALAAAYVGVTLLTYLREERQRSYIHNAFDRYLSPELVRRIASDPGQLELGGEEREMTVLFCDVRSFSRISEGMAPKDIIRFLIAFLTPMTDILLQRKATLDKFIGDAILAFWNAPLDDPDQYANAARAALAMQSRLSGLNKSIPAEGGTPWPDEVKIGIGINSGPCCVGNMGSAQRLSYTLIGDTVNLASRIEGLTKHYGVGIAIGSALAAKLTGFALLELDQVRVVGRDAPETLFTLVGDDNLAIDAGFHEHKTAHAAMIAAYRSREWADAQAKAEQLAAAGSYGLAHFYRLYADRAAGYAATPPQRDWDGVYNATEK